MTRSPRDAPDAETHLEIHFKDGVPVKVVDLTNGVDEDGPPRAFRPSERGRRRERHRPGRHGREPVRRASRAAGVYETPGMTILRAAHMDIEGIAMDREVMRLRDMLTPKFAELVYNGFWFSPEMDFLMAAIDKSQEVIDGTVRLTLYKGNVTITGRESPSSLYDKELSSMDIEGGFDQQDSAGLHQHQRHPAQGPQRHHERRGERR